MFFRVRDARLRPKRKLLLQGARAESADLQTAVSAERADADEADAVAAHAVAAHAVDAVEIGDSAKC